MASQSNIRNFVIIAHIDHGKSTLADRLLEMTGTVEKRKMREQYLDSMDLERERGITIKMQPVRMSWHSNRRITQNRTQNDAEDFDRMSWHPDRRPTQNRTQNNAEDFLYGDLTYKIRGILFQVRKKIGLGHKEQIYHNTLEIEFKNAGLKFESKKNIPIFYEGKSVGTYQPDFLVENKVLLELKALPEIGKPQIKQLWSYLKGCDYKLALLVNFGGKDLEIKRVVYDTVRNNGLRFSASGQRESAEIEYYVLNLIDTPGHVDFSYEVSRSLAAVEGAILLVDATKGVEAQTLANLELAKRQGLVIIPVINKIDLSQAKIEETSQELEGLTESGEILRISAKTGENVEDIFMAIAEKMSSPKGDVEKPLKALIFDSQYDSYKGIIVHVRIFDGEIRSGEKIKFLASGAESETLEVGIFAPKLEPRSSLAAGEIGYIATGLKDIEKCRVGDTITLANLHKYATNNTNAVCEISGKFVHISDIQPLAGYKEPKPMVFASIFPENGDDFDLLKDGISKLKLNDASLIFEPEQSMGLGRGLRCGFLGMLHLDIILERLKREYKLDLVVSSPSVEYKITDKNSGAMKFARSAAEVEDISGTKIIEEPWAKIEIITPLLYLGAVMELLEKSRGLYQDTKYLSQNTILLGYEAPLADIIIDFYDQLKNVSSGYASMNYEFMGHRIGDLIRLDILVAGQKFDAFSRIIPRTQSYYEARKIVKKLKEILPKQLFEVSIQAAIGGKIIARETIRALKKDVTGYLYGGDITRKKKLWEKQKRGKKRMKTMGRVDIPPEVFRELLKK